MAEGTMIRKENRKEGLLEAFLGGIGDTLASRGTLPQRFLCMLMMALLRW